MFAIFKDNKAAVPASAGAPWADLFVYVNRTFAGKPGKKHCRTGGDNVKAFAPC